MVSLWEKTEDDVSIALAPSAGQGRGGKERKTRISKRGRVAEGRPTKRTPEVVAKIAEAVAIGLTDEKRLFLQGSTVIR